MRWPGNARRSSGALPGLRLLLLIAALGATGCGSPGEKQLAFADSLAYKGDYPRAMAAYEMALERLPLKAFYRRVHARKRAGEIAYLFLGEYRRALRHFRALAELDDSDEGFAARVAIAEIVRFKFNDQRQAIVEYQRLLQAYPSHPQASQYMLEIAQAYAQLGDSRQARVEGRLLLERYPNSPHAPEVMLLVADGLALEGDLDHAIAEYERFLVEYKDHSLVPTAAFELATCYEDSGQPEMAHRRLTEIAATLKNPQAVQRKIDRLRARMRQRGH